jgi:tetratricopeptide (TPR) repeat protein
MRSPAALREGYSRPIRRGLATFAYFRLNFLALSNAFLLLQCAFSPVLSADVQSVRDADLKQIEAILQKNDGPVPASALKKLEKILETNPESCPARLLLAQYYERLAWPDEAAQQIAIAVNDVPNDQQKLIDLITSNLLFGHIKSASALVEEARRRFPRNARISFLQGQIYSEEKQADRAEQAFIRAERSAGRSGEKILGLATALAEIRNGQRRFEEGYSLAGIDISSDARFWPAYKAKGIAALGLGYSDEAVKLLFVAYRNLGQAEAAGSFASAAYRAGRFDVALAPALINLAANPLPGEFSSGPKKLIIDIWKKLPAHEGETIIVRTESRSDLVANAKYHFAMGEVMDSLRRYDLAVEEYRCALQARPDLEQAFYRRGADMEVYFHRYDDAVRDYKQALKLVPEYYDAQQSLIRLQNRLRRRPDDISWQLKDLLSTPRK